MDTTETLFVLLKANQKYDVQYKRGLSNHLSMALIALFFLDATESDLERYCHYYLPKLEPVAETMVTIEKQDWREYLGQHKFYKAFYHFFKNESLRLNIKELLQTYLPHLAPGMGADAFHALIRLAYAVELYQTRLLKKDGVNRELLGVAKNEVIISLAYWADSYLPLPAIDGNVDAEQMVQQLVATKYPINLSHLRLIYTRMEQVSSSKEYRQLAKNLKVTEATYPLLTEVVLAAYLKTPNFTLLHAVTSLQALSIVLPFAGNKDNVLNAYWRALVSAYLTVADLDENNSSSIEELSWNEIKKRACSSNDEHVIKLVYSSWCKFQETNDSRYTLISSRAVQDVVAQA